MQPLNSALILARASSGAIQLLLGPASSRFFVQMNVRCSTRATSDGCEYAMWQPGKVVWLSFLSSPDFSRVCFSLSSSAGEPSHHWILSGVVSLRTDSTQSATAGAISGSERSDWGAVAITLYLQLSVCPDETKEYSGDESLGDHKC